MTIETPMTIRSLIAPLSETVPDKRLTAKRRQQLTTRGNDLLIQAARSGSAPAFSQLIQAHDAAARGLVFGMVRNGTVTDEILQEAYLKTYRSLGSFRQASSFKTWLHRIVYTTTIDELRKAKRVVPMAPIEISDANPDRSISIGDTVANRLDIANALALLPERQRAIVLLVDGHEFSYGDVGDILGMPAGTVGFHLHAARKALRKHLTITKDAR